MANAGEKWWADFLKTHKRPGTGASEDALSYGDSESSGAEKNAGQEWWDNFIKTHKRPSVQSGTEKEVPTAQTAQPGKTETAAQPLAAWTPAPTARVQMMELPNAVANVTGQQHTIAHGMIALNRDKFSGAQGTSIDAAYLEDQAAIAQKEYEDYINSEEYQNAEDERSVLDVIGDSIKFQDKIKTAKGKELKAKADYYKNQADSYRNQAIILKDMEELESWTEEEKKLLKDYVALRPLSVFIRPDKALVDKYGSEKVESMAESYEWTESRKITEQTTEHAKNTLVGEEKEGKKPVWEVISDKIFLPEITYSAGTVGGNLVGAVTAPAGYANELLNRTGRLSTLNPNNLGALPLNWSSSVRQTVGDEIRGEGGFIREAAGAVYDAGMSDLDTLARIAAAGPIGALALSFTGSFSQTVSQASAQGASPAEAVSLGVINGGLEIITEKMSLDRLLGYIGSNPQNAMKIVKNALIQGGVEASEEELSLLGSTLAEAAILREKSSYNQSIQQMVAGGKSYEEAKAIADQALIQEAWQTLYTSYLSGSMMSAGGSAVAYMGRDKSGVQAAQGVQAEEQVQDQAPEISAAAPQAEAVAEETVKVSPVDAALEVYKQTGTVTNRIVRDILNDPDAVERLTKEAGLALPETASGQRNAVKAAVTELNRKLELQADLGATAERIIRDQNKQPEPPLSDEAKRQRLNETMAEMAGIPKQEVVKNVDTPRQLNYDNAIEKGGTGYGTGTDDHGRNGRDTQIDPQKQAAGSAENGGGNVRPGDQSGVFGGNGQEVVYTSDSEGRSVTQEQAAQLRDTAIVDENGAPVAVYHSTDNMEFDTFAKGDVGFHFGTQEQAAKRSGDKGSAKGRTFRAYLNIKNPVRASKDIMGWHPGGTALLLWNDGILTEAEMREVTGLFKIGDGYDSEAAVRLREILENKGYDGIVYPNGFEGDGDSYIAFRDDQIIRSEIRKFGEDADMNHGAVGAAERNFSGAAEYEALLSDENAQRDRPGDVRPVEVPKTDRKGRDISEFVGNAYGSALTPDTFIPTIQRLLMDGDLSNDVQTNEETLRKAAEALAKDGDIKTSTQRIADAASKGMTSAQTAAEATLLYSYLTEETDELSQSYAADVFVSLTQLATNSGRALQVFSLFRRMTTKGQMTAIQMTVRRNVADMVRKGIIKKNSADYTVAPELMEEFRKASEDLRRIEEAEQREADAQNRLDQAKEVRREADKEAESAERKAEKWEQKRQEAEQRKRDAEQRVKDARDAIYLQVASRQKATFKAKWDAFRYMAMLGNVKTQIRNFMGNVGYMPYTELKRVLGAAMELAIAKENRTKALVGLSKADRALTAWAKADVKTDDVQKALEYSAKLGDDTTMAEIRDSIRVYNWDWLEKTREFVGDVPGKADMLFKEGEYIRSLSGFLKARGYTAADITNGNVSEAILNEGRTYAVYEALKATFNDSNKFSDAIANLRYHGDNPFIKAISIAGEGVLPLRRTPANVVVRAVENSPVGIARGFWNLANQVRKGEMSAATAIDRIAAGLTGSGMWAAGYFLASGALGFFRIRGGVDEEKERQGYQDYAIEIKWNGKWYSYTIDWAAPANMPLFVGANIYGMREDMDAGMSPISAIAYAGLNSLEPLLALSCMSSLNDLFETGRYAEEGTVLYSAAVNVATNYFTQAIPALLRQTAQAFQPNQRQTFANSADPLARDAQRTLAGIPVIGEFFKTDKVDEWGQTVSKGGVFWQIFNAFVNPGTLSQIDNSTLEQEITRLHKAQPESVAPPDTPKTISYTDKDGNVHKDQRLTAEEYTELKTVQGQTAMDILSKAVESDDYKALTDAQKVKVFEYAYAYAREKGREAALEGYRIEDSWMIGIGGNEAETIINKVVTGEFTDAFGSLTNAWKNGWDVSEATEALGEAYSVYDSLGDEAQRALRENASGRVKDYLLAADAGVDAETFTQLYHVYSDLNNDPLMKSSTKAQKWSYELEKAVDRGDITEAQKTVLKNNIAISSGFTVETEKYDTMIESGIGTDDANQVIGDLSGLEKEEGYSTVRTVQKMEAISQADYLSEQERIAVMQLYMTDSQIEKMDTIMEEIGISAEAYAALYRAHLPQDKKAEETAAFMALGYSEREAENIYRLYNPPDEK